MKCFWDQPKVNYTAHVHCNEGKISQIPTVWLTYLINSQYNEGCDILPNNKWDSNMLILIGEKSKLLVGCDCLRIEYSFMENSDKDSCKMGCPVRLFSSWQGGHVELKPPHEKGTGVGRTES